MAETRNRLRARVLKFLVDFAWLFWGMVFVLFLLHSAFWRGVYGYWYNISPEYRNWAAVSNLIEFVLVLIMAFLLPGGLWRFPRNWIGVISSQLFIALGAWLFYPCAWFTAILPLGALALVGFAAKPFMDSARDPRRWLGLLLLLILILIALPNYMKAKDWAPEAEIQSDVHSIQLGLERYHVDHDKYPNTLDVLISEGYFFKFPRNAYVGRCNVNWKSPTLLRRCRYFCTNCLFDLEPVWRMLEEADVPQRFIDSYRANNPQLIMDMGPVYPYLTRLSEKDRRVFLAGNLFYRPIDSDSDGQVESYWLAGFGFPWNKGRDGLLPDGSIGEDGIRDGIIIVLKPSPP